MKTLEIDIETFSSINLSKSGVYRYVEAPDFEILLFAYSIDDGDVKVIDLAMGEKIPKEILDALADPNIIKWAFNANFERICLSRYLGYPTGKYLDPSSWRCSMIWSAYMGLPLSLEGAGTVLGLEKQKLKDGKDLIRYFCTPCKPTKTNGKRTRNHPYHDLEKWSAFKEYNKRDVETELEIQMKLSKFPVPEHIWHEYHLDQEINDRGVLLDLDFIKNAIEIGDHSRTKLIDEMKALTNLDNPNSVQQLKGWLSENGLETESLGKKIVSELLETATGDLSKVLTLRQQISKSSIKKYQTMENAVGSDNRARGMFQFYGANRTGRFAGRILQPQNLPRNNIPDLYEARELVHTNNITALDMLYDSIPEVLSQLIRTSFIPKANHKFIVADFSSIERVVLAWLADEKWVLDAYNRKEDLYIATASQMFDVPIEKIDKKSPLRDKGKVADLACGYGGSVGALISMGALDMGLEEYELKPLVDSWRLANSNIVNFWWDVDRAVLKTVRERTTTTTHGIEFSYKSGMLFIALPSGRKLSYVKPKIGLNQFGSDCVTYEGLGGTKKWERINSYGPKFVENIVQAISRDILIFSMEKLRHFSIVMHIHDEIIIEAEKHITVDEICKIMCQTPPWSKGLQLRAEGFEGSFYKKD
ncbi:MAG: DNA polymerase I, 3'-5' exonuclease and polymerase domains [Xylanivirga thermophila]|jgi:DNA polymerase bacteriophage-type|uniref:DNA polymerase n=1 Tax=Xylanivirga thermophila TaxID=2496273 RepID=UPI0039F461A7